MSKYNQNPANPTPPYQQQVFQFIASVVGQNNIIAIPVEFVRFTGDYNTAAILNQLIYWQGKGDDPDGWIYKTYDQWETEVALSKYQANRAVKTLTTMGIIETKVTRVKLKNGMYGDKAVHYMFNEETFVDLFGKQLNIVDSKDPSLSKVKELNHGKCSNSSFLPLITETSYNDYSNQKNPPLPPLKIKLKKPIPPPVAEAPKATMEKALVALALLIPESMRKPSTVAKLAKAIENGIAIATIKEAILFANDRSDRKTLKRYQGMLGGCIDKGWSTGYQGEDKQEVDEAAVNYATKERAFLESRRTMPTDILKTDAAKGCKASQQVLQERQIK